MAVHIREGQPQQEQQVNDRLSLDEIDDLLEQYIAEKITQTQCIVRISRVIGLNNQERKQP